MIIFPYKFKKLPLIYRLKVILKKKKKEKAKRANSFQKQLFLIHLGKRTRGTSLAPSKEQVTCTASFPTFFWVTMALPMAPNQNQLLPCPRTGVGLWICLPLSFLYSWVNSPQSLGRRPQPLTTPQNRDFSTRQSLQWVEKPPYICLLTPTYDCVRKPFVFCMPTY